MCGRTSEKIMSPAPKRLLRNRAGQSWSVCPRFFGGIKPFSRSQSPKNGDSTNQIGNTRFGEIWHTFLEEHPFWGDLAHFFGKMQDFMQDNLKPFCRTNTGFARCRRKTDFAKCKILGLFFVVSFRVSTICIVLVKNMVVLRVPIQNKGEPKK